MKKLVLFILLITIPSFILGIHNATLYNPVHGFDGINHLKYMQYVYKYHNLPQVNWRDEYHQSPIYYIVGAIIYTITRNWKSPQYINIVVLWMIIGMVGVGLHKVFRNKILTFIGMFALAALPMLNIFPAMLTNELLNTFWIISVAVCSLFIVSAKTKKNIIVYTVWFTVSFILGYWTKVSIILIIPTIILAYAIAFSLNQKLRKVIFMSFLTGAVLCSLLSYPIFIRARTGYGGSDIVTPIMKRVTIRQNTDFFYRLDWIPKVDMYNTQYYSLLGGAWNSFWTDGQNAITPFIKFHKKSFILWIEGFLLLPICIYGLIRLWGNKKTYAVILYTIATTMLFVYVWFNLGPSHFSAVRLTYEMGIVLPYAFGIASAFRNKKLQVPIILLLIIQFVVMVSFFWIQPWWFSAK